VLRAARAHGIAQVVGIRRNDARHPARALDWDPAVSDVADLLPVAGA
jgi:hypothetical protein